MRPIILNLLDRCRLSSGPAHIVSEDTLTSALDFGPGTSEVVTEGLEGSSGIKSTVLNPLLDPRVRS
jgi:hypothetical protein